MTQQTIDTYLECVDGVHNKFYLARVAEEDDGSWSATCLYGAIGAKPQTTVKYRGPSRAVAEGAAARVVSEKMGKGYVLVRPVPAALAGAAPSAAPATASAAPAAAPRPAFGPASTPDTVGVPRFGAQLCGDLGMASLEAAVADPGEHLVERKLDGFRALVVLGDDGSITVRNRSGEDKGRGSNIPHIADELRRIADEQPVLWQGTVLDGELVGADWSETARLLGAAGRSDPSLRFVVFDLPWHAGLDLRDRPLRFRRSLLTAVLADARGPVELSAPLAPALDLAQEVWDEGGEGLVIKSLAAPYRAGDRSAWSKVKQLRTGEGVVMGFEPGKGKYAGGVGAVILGQMREGRLVEVTRVSGMTDAVRASLDDGWVGRVVEFEYQERTDSSYRHPRWLRPRPDRSPAECRWES